VLTSVILATQEAEIRRIVVQSSQADSSARPYLEKTLHKKKKAGRGGRLMEWLKV
jgi:hypothetical protein